MRYKAIEVIDRITQEVIHTIKLAPPKSMKQASRVEDGVWINLDADKFYTRLVEADDG